MADVQNVTINFHMYNGASHTILHHSKLSQLSIQNPTRHILQAEITCKNIYISVLCMY